MKLSLAWIFDHIDACWKQQDVEVIVQKFNAIVAEIEHVEKIHYDLAPYFLVQAMSERGVTRFFAPALGQELIVSVRNDAYVGAAYMVKKTEHGYVWATLKDFGLDKEGLMPALSVGDADLVDGWKALFHADDVIFDVDNKTLNHRPDMWGHRGFAREIAAFLGLPLKDESLFLRQHAVKSDAHSVASSEAFPIGLRSLAGDASKKFAGLALTSVCNKPCDVLIASRLIAIGNRPINALVDISNYVAADFGQPMHVYDAAHIKGNEVVVRFAHAGEKLLLLDGQELTLTDQDLVVANAHVPMCLAGVMGGAHSGVTLASTAAFIEAAHFDAATVRRAALRHKVRTESSARFEKSLDPEGAATAVFRFLFLLEKTGIVHIPAQALALVGSYEKAVGAIEISHRFLEQRIGVTLATRDVVEPLERLGFSIVRQENTQDGVVYHVEIPSFRASKDIRIQEDILEEVARCYGFVRIPHELPVITREPYAMQAVMRERKIKHFLASGARMMEQLNYAFFDESFLQRLGLTELHALAVLNPVSENYARLATSLVPGLLKNMYDNQMERESLAFFECGRIWIPTQSSAQERKQLAGIVFERRATVDFYHVKDQLLRLFDDIGLDGSALSWHKASENISPWYLGFQTAVCQYQDHIIGYAGMMDQAMLAKIDALPESTAFVFELDLDLLLTLSDAPKRYTPISRFQDTYFDVSLMIPLSLTFACLEQAAAAVSPLLKRVELVDFFENKAWADRRSVTMRCWLSSVEKTMGKEEIDAVWQRVVDAVSSLGAQLRAGA
ncbi:MAG: Phenylalanine-tRNA ligase beta subunit [candidate division TM6 bacterium GW2011_GWF2_38_10]|nr:MAG: Phenylalanine-tRNA ligase beta subunit [candidate division TM6 bacterium GW2011_GWF2_38_10]